MKGSFRIGRWFGIDVFLHVTFLLVLAFVAIAHGTAAGNATEVAAVMRREFPATAPGELLEDALQRQREAELSMVPVLRNGELVGLLTWDNLSEFLLIKSALDARRPPVLALR